MLNLRSGLALVALAAAMAVYSALHLDVGTDITRFLPVGSASQLAALSSRLADSPLTRTMVLSVGADDTATAIAAARELGEWLGDHPEVAWVRSEVGEADLEEIYSLYFPRRLAFLSDDPERSLPGRLSEAGLRERARKLKIRLASPVSGFFESLVTEDPLGAFESLVTGLQGGESSLRSVDGQLVTPDGRFAIVLLGTHSSAFDSGAQGVLLDDLRATFATLARRRGSGLVLEMSAVGAFAVAAERSIKGDIYTIAVLSFTGVGLLFFGLVGSLRGFLVVSVPPLAGILTATTLGLLVFGQLDGLTMAFGASLMGIAIDYSNHLLLHFGLGPRAARQAEGGSPLEVARRLRPSLVMGALTTVASFVGLGLTPFPAFREMSFFAITGVLAALAVSLWVLPSLLPRVPELPTRAARIAARLDRGFRRLEALPRLGLLGVLGAAALSVLALPAVEWSDDMARLTRFDPELVAEDQRVRERVARLEGRRFVIGIAPDADAAVALNDAIHERLRAPIAAGALDATRSLHTLLWSTDLQRRNRAALASQPELYARIDAAFAAEGFRSGALARFGAALEAPPPAPLRLADLRASGVADLLAPYVFDLGEDVAVVTYLRGLRDPDAVDAALAGLPGVHLLDQRNLVTDIYREFRRTSLRQILVGGGLVVLLLALRYRAWRPVFAAFLPSLLVAGVVLAVGVGLDEPANLFTVMSLVMVMGMGVDYGIFCVDSLGRDEELGTTLVSLLLSCLTTAFVFGSLAMSAQPSLRAIGLTTGLGVVLSLLLAPIAVAAVGVRRPSELPLD